ncbi:hypothetical protein [Alteromonas sp. KUL49]|uniref:hypothetical protein n=1 Tax=Alteromonas sp. KUL49 TaxID=2480798 RepID=UPI00102F0533|nr:hypothetical protein [Alteromonas sp. KUL49]TAP40976.1 hypothetical protein EYS00_07675 [Alteromonas sp. KUL49]
MLTLRQDYKNVSVDDEQFFSGLVILVVRASSMMKRFVNVTNFSCADKVFMRYLSSVSLSSSRKYVPNRQ